MTDVKYMPVQEALEQVTGIRPSKPTCQRLVSSGQLKTWKVLGKRLTTAAAVQEYVDRCASQAAPAAEESNALAALDKELAGS